MTDEEIHNIWLHMSGKSEGLLEAGGKADFPVLFTNAILEFNKRKWVGLTGPVDRNEVLEEVAKEFDKMKSLGDTAASFAAYVRNMKS